MERSLYLAVTVLLLFGAAAAGQQVSYEKYRLPNGLTVIMHEDHSLPLACVNLWYRVGAKDEKERRSGFAHLFEHLMFMGTRRVPGGDFDVLMEEGGGYNNASTSEDRTNYYSCGPAELLPTLLWLDADRLEDLGREMTLEKLDKQREVVRNERRQMYENAPYGKAELKIYELMFPKGHPYQRTVIGSHEDLEAATVDDVKDFFASYYVPSNASLVVAGHFDKAEVKPLIERLFGTLPRGSDVSHAMAEPVKLGGVKRLTMTDAVQYARTSIVYHSPPHFAPGDAEMDLAAAILSSGISSRLYQRLVYQDQLAVDVAAYQSSMMLGSLFYIEATAKPGVSLDTVEKAIDEVLAEFTTTGPTPAELERQIAQLEFRMVAQLQSILAKADKLNEYEFHFGEPDSFQRDLERYRGATAAAVQAWAKKVLTPDARLVLRVIPEIEIPEANPRDERPGLADAAGFAPPLPESFQLKNGVTVYHWQKSELPLVALRLLLPSAGSEHDGPVQAGLAMLTADMLDEGAGSRDAIEFSDALDALGATLLPSSSYDAAMVDLSVLSRNVQPALALLADAVLRPKFDAREWQRVQSLHVENLRRALDQPQVVSNWVAMRTYFGDAHPYSRSTVGTPTTVERLTLDDIRQFHQSTYRPSTAVILVAGDLTAEAAKAQLEAAFASWAEPASAMARQKPEYVLPQDQKLRVAIVDRPEAVQTVIRFVMPGPTYADPRRIPLDLFNNILGGTFTSRLNLNLRERNGYTYGASSRYNFDPRAGYFTAASSVRADVTGPALREFLHEFAAIRAGNIAPEEARKSRTTARRELMESFQGVRGTLAAATTLIRNGRPFSDLAEELASLDNVSEGVLNGLAKAAVPLEQGLLLLVGDKRLILEQIKGLDLPEPIELTAAGDLK